MDLKVQDIRRSLGWSRKLLEEGKEKGDILEANLIHLNLFTINITIIQILFLILYAVVWVFWIKRQKRN